MGSLLSNAITFFLIANPIGNSPAIIALIKDFNFDRQKRIMLRESLYGLLLALFFQYVGELFLNQLKIENYTLSFAGGILLLLVALDMLFHTRPASKTAVGQRKDPVFVPIATPLISGPGLLSMIMVFSQREQNNLEISLAILLAWVGITAVLVSAPYLNRILGSKGLAVLEQIMGLLVAMMAIDMIVSGAQMFIKTFRYTCLL